MNNAWTRRALLRAIPVAGVTIASGCGIASESSGQEFPETNVRLPWNAPENVAAAQRNPPPTHLGDLYFRGPALSPDGSLFAITLANSPVNELAIIDLARRTGWYLSHPNYRIKLAHPAFAPDGRSIAVVVTPPTYFGSSEIWIAPIDGGEARVILERPSACYMSPQFSADGRRIVCFGDANQTIPQRILRSYRTGLVPLSVYEISLDSGTGVKVSERAWSWAEFVAFAPRRDGFYARTGLPAPSSPERYSMRHERFGFFLARDGDPRAPLPSIIPEHLRRGGGQLAGVDDSGVLLVRVSRPNDRFRAGAASVLVRCIDGSSSDGIALDDIHIQVATTSRDGKVIAGSVTRRIIRDQDTVTPAHVQQYVVLGRDERIQAFTFPDDITFDQRRRLLSPVGPSEMAS